MHPKLEIVEVKRLANDVLEVTMKNGYKKDITAIAASAGDNHFFYRDYICAELEAGQRLAPGATDTFSYTPIRSFGVLPKVVVSGVIFGDGTTKGDRGKVSYILDKRLGMKIQLNRIKPYLESLDKVKDSQIRAELGKLKGIAGALPIDKGDGSPMSRGVDHGLTHGRAFILHYLSKLERVLENERIESFYEKGVLQTVRHSGDDDFRISWARVQKDLKGLASRL